MAGTAPRKRACAAIGTSTSVRIPTKATVAAAKYLKTLANLFSGDWHLALASYNGGPGRVQKAIKRVGVDDFWTLADNPKRAAARDARVRADDPRGDHHRPQPGAIRLRVRAGDAGGIRQRSRCRVRSICGGSPNGPARRSTEIQALNPELRRWTTPLKDAQYELKVPAGTADQVTARLQDAPPVDLVSLKWYTVKKGETLPPSRASSAWRSRISPRPTT